MTSPAFDRYIAPARRRPALWRIALGLIAAAAVFVVFNIGLFTAVGQIRLPGVADSLTRPDGPFSVLLLFASFLGLMLAAVAAAALHRRGPRSLFGPDLRRGAGHFAVAALTVWAVYAPMMALWSLVFDSLPGLDPGTWLALLPLTILGLLVQTGSEEMMFRGYLTQQLAARFRSPVVWVAVPALAFGALHYMPGTPAATVALMIGSAVLFGLVATDLTVRTGGLGAAWGFHFANNFAAIALVSTQGTITGIALRLTPYGADDPSLILPLTVVDLTVLGLAWWILRTWLRRRADPA